MVVDYLRYVAFAGRLRNFFRTGVYEFAGRDDTTGQHLRFSPDYVSRRYSESFFRTVRSLYWNSTEADYLLEQLKDELGIGGGHDSLLLPVAADEAPVVREYNEYGRPPLEIIIDIDPQKWSARYEERRSIEDVPIRYRRAGPATTNNRSGDVIFDQTRGAKAAGTLCGFFISKGGGVALTCGHVAALSSRIASRERRSLGPIPVGSRYRTLGTTVACDITSSPRTVSNISTRLDAALIAVNRPVLVGAEARRSGATFMPISRIVQEVPVVFRGGGRSTDTLARVAAITVRKSIDLFKDGHLHDVGDLLMLGHRSAMYTAKRVSNPGDSGAAVRSSFSAHPSHLSQEWHGMVIGGDDTGAFATYAEHLWGWVAETLQDNDIEFTFDL